MVSREQRPSVSTQRVLLATLDLPRPTGHPRLTASYWPPSTNSTAHRVRLLVGVLLAAHSQRQPVDEVDCDALLLPRHVARLHVSGVVLAHLWTVVTWHVGR